MATETNRETPEETRARQNRNLRPARKGQSGNPRGRPPGKSIRQLLREQNTGEKLAVVQRMYALAKEGDVRAAEWIARHGEVPTLEVTTREFTVALEHPDDD